MDDGTERAAKLQSGCFFVVVFSSKSFIKKSGLKEGKHPLKHGLQNQNKIWIMVRVPLLITKRMAWKEEEPLLNRPTIRYLFQNCAVAMRTRGRIASFSC